MALRWTGYNGKQGQMCSGSRIWKDALRAGPRPPLRLPGFPGRILPEYGETSATSKEGSPGSARPQSHATIPGITVLHPPGVTGKATHQWCWAHG